MANKKYAVWQISNESKTKEYIYAQTHREASNKYKKKHTKVSIHDVETRKV